MVAVAVKDWGRILVSTRLEKQVTPRFFRAWSELITQGLRPGDGFLSVAGKVAHRAQNDVVRHFLDGDWDTLLTLDSDADVPPDFLERFRSHEPGWEFDVLQAFYPRRGWPPRAIWMKRNALGDMMECFVTEPDRTEEVDMIGTHACLFRREVFTRLLGDGDAKTHDWFFYPRHDNASEDGAFSEEAQTAGFRLGATSAVRAGHVTEVTTTWDTYQEYLQVTGRLSLLDRYNALAQEIAAFTGETPELVIAKAASGPSLVRQAWECYHQVAHVTASEERAFYGEQVNGYLYDLLNWNCQPLYERILAPLRGISGQRVLVVGCGLGTEADAMADRNRVDIFELPGVLKDFAMRRLGTRVDWMHGETLTDVFGEDEQGEYDLIVAIDVLEHIHPDEIDETLGVLGMVLKSNGALYCHNNWGQQETYPMHHDNRAAFARFCEARGLVQKGEFLWEPS